MQLISRAEFKPYSSMLAQFAKELIHIGIADDHKLFRQAMKYALVLDDNIRISFEAENGNDLIKKLSFNRPDILLLDLKMPELNGIDALKIITEKFAFVKVLVVTAFLDEVYVAECLKYGIYGYLTKTMEIEEVHRAIKMVHRGELYSSNLLTNQLYKQYSISFHKLQRKDLPPFSNEEIMMLDLLKAEKTTEEISMIMNLSKRSVEIKRDKMREKSHTKTVAGLLLYAIKRGIIE